MFLEEKNNKWNTPYLFNGKELDEETGLYYYGARYYNGRTSIWLSVDPLAEKHPSVSPYVYVLNNPVKFIDLFGLDSLAAAELTKAAQVAVNYVKENYGEISAQCNRGVNKAFQEVTGSDELSGINANDMIDKIEKSKKFKVLKYKNLSEVQDKANDGDFIIAGKKEENMSGHVALVVPGKLQLSKNWEKAPEGMDTGKTHRWTKKSLSYSWGKKDGVKFYKYIGESQKVYDAGEIPTINVKTQRPYDVIKTIKPYVK